MVDRSDGFGTTLRLARERRGISLQDIARRTKISVHALEALERDDYSRLPGGIFSRAFVRSYAVEVGLDPDETIEQFLAQFPRGAAVTVGHSQADQIEDGEALESERQTALTFIRLIALSIPIVGVILYLNSGVRQQAPQPEAPRPAPASPVPGEPTSAPKRPMTSSEVPPAVPATGQRGASAVAVQPMRSDSTTAVADPRAAGPAVPATMSASRLTVTLSASGPCWISAIVDENAPIEQLMQAGDQRTFEVHREVILKAGDAAAISMTLNGAAAKPLGKPGEVVTARLNLTNFKDYLAQP